MQIQASAIPNSVRGEAADDSGQGPAQANIWEAFRGRLKRCASARMDNRISARVDPSDVVQEVYLQAFQKMDEFAEVNGSGQFRILKKMVVGHAIDFFRRHIRSARRSVTREITCDLALGGDSGSLLRDELASSTIGPGEKFFREETLEQLRAALEQLSAADRRLLEMRHLQRLSVADIADRLHTSRTVVTTRHCRAIRRLRRILEAALAAE